MSWYHRSGSYEVVWTVRDRRPREHLVLLHGTGLSALRCRAKRPLHVVVETSDDVPCWRALEVRRFFLRDAIFDLSLTKVLVRLESRLQSTMPTNRRSRSLLFSTSSRTLACAFLYSAMVGCPAAEPAAFACLFSAMHTYVSSGYSISRAWIGRDRRGRVRRCNVLCKRQ